MDQIETYTSDNVRQRVLDTIGDLEHRGNLFRIVCNELSSWEGKVINVRLKNRLRQLLPGYIVLVKKTWNGIEIIAYKGCGMEKSTINYENPFVFRLTKSTLANQRVSEDIYSTINPSYFGAAGTVFSHIITLKDFLTCIPEVVDRWNQALQDVADVAKLVPDIYPISRLFYIPITLRR